MEKMEVRIFWKVIIIKVDVFFSEIIDERHFSEMEKAISFQKECMERKGIIGIVCPMCDNVCLI